MAVVLAGVAEDPEELDEAGALAAGAGVEAGAGVDTGAAVEFPEPAAGAVPASLFALLWDDFLAEDAAGAAEESAAVLSAFLDLPDDFLEVEVSAAGADEEFSAVASDLVLLFFFSEEVSDEAAAEEPRELSDAAVSLFFDFLDLGLEELWSLLEALCDCPQLKSPESARRKHNDKTNACAVFIVDLC